MMEAMQKKRGPKGRETLPSPEGHYAAVKSFEPLLFGLDAQDDPAAAAGVCCHYPLYAVADYAEGPGRPVKPALTSGWQMPTAHGASAWAL